MNIILVLVLAQAPAPVARAAPQSATFVVIQEPEPHPRVLHAAITYHVIAQFADATTTAYAMGRGGFYEHNPLMRPFAGNPVRLAIVKGAYAAGTSALFLRLHRSRPKTAFVMATGHAVFTSVIASRNGRTVQKAP